MKSPCGRWKTSQVSHGFFPWISGGRVGNQSAQVKKAMVVQETQTEKEIRVASSRSSSAPVAGGEYQLGLCFLLFLSQVLSHRLAGILPCFRKFIWMQIGLKTHTFHLLVQAIQLPRISTLITDMNCRYIYLRMSSFFHQSNLPSE